MDFAYWVEAEIANLSVRGHCYMELVEKDERSNTPIAKARGNCWANQWSFVSRNFIEVAGTPLAAGMKVLLQVRPTFHESFGFAWNIINIDPTYTIGDMQRRREEIIRQLKEEGVYDLQKQLSFSAFTKNIAVISSQDAAGYGDFCNQLHNNSYGFSFYTELFPAIMQGEQVEQSVIAALNRIYERVDDFDCVVIIRGGGAVTDMSGFDTLPLAENVVQFPLPIITGIGHERDNCVLDLISHTRVKTPTAAAVFLIENLTSTLEIINIAKERIERNAVQILQNERLRLNSLTERIPALFAVVSTKQNGILDNISERLIMLVNNNLQQKRNQLELLNERLKAHNPELLLSRGYSMTFINGKLLTSAKQAKKGDTITTTLKSGKIESIVK